MKKINLSLILLLCLCTSTYAQTDTEFPKGFIMHTKLHSGMVTNFHSGTDAYVGGIQLVPQFTVVEHKLRVGAIAGGFYTGQKLQVMIGPTASFKLKTINAGVFGSAANIHISADHLWGTEKQQLVGGGIHVDLLNKLVIGFTAHRDYHLNTWWFQESIGIRISRKKTVKDKF